MLQEIVQSLKDLDTFLFVVLPYLVFGVFLLVTIQRYRRQSFTYSSLSSQFLENKHHFWGMVPFHYGILVVLGGHFVAFLVPSSILAWNSHPLRLFILEASALVCGILTLIGFVNVMIRRMRNARVKVVTSHADRVLYAILLFQIASGIYVAVTHRWGSSWYASNAAPYLWSLLSGRPKMEFVTALPWAAKLHMISAFLLVGFFPFTRLVHILVVPNPYLWRKTQVVRWNRDRLAPRSR